MKNKRLIVVLSAVLVGMVLFTFARSSYFDKPNPAPGYMQRGDSAAEQRDSLKRRTILAVDSYEEAFYPHEDSYLTPNKDCYKLLDREGCEESKTDWRNLIDVIKEFMEYEGNKKWIGCRKVPETMPSGVLKEYIDDDYNNLRFNIAPSEGVREAMNAYLEDISDEITWRDLTARSAFNC